MFKGTKIVIFKRSNFLLICLSGPFVQQEHPRALGRSPVNGCLKMSGGKHHPTNNPAMNLGRDPLGDATY